MKLDRVEGLQRMDFNLSERTVTVYHSGNHEPILAGLRDLDLDSALLDYEPGIQAPDVVPAPSSSHERRPLVAAFCINLGLFLGEFLAGLLAGSMGLVADSLDMLADSVVYGLSLSAVGRSRERKRRVARLSGYFQMGLALMGLLEVARRLIGAAEPPDVLTMIVMSALALAGNILTLWLLSRTSREEAHMKASWIFTSNDIKVNLLVMFAGGIVHVTGSGIPDLLAGGLIFLIVANGARKILKLSTPRS